MFVCVSVYVLFTALCLAIKHERNIKWKTIQRQIEMQFTITMQTICFVVHILHHKIDRFESLVKLANKINVRILFALSVSFTINWD